MIKKLAKVLEFLKENQSYNQELQKRFSQGTMGSKTSKFDKLTALLYDTASTQSQPKIDKLANFFQKVYKNKNDFDDFYTFVKLLNKDYIVDEDDPYESLFKGLSNQEGWGNKTSALFVKYIIHYHHNSEWSEFKIWDDMPPVNGKVYLPVDAVILAIFDKLNSDPKPKWNFKTVNEVFQDNFSFEEIILFDDLWFWGFITQDSSKQNTDDQEYWDKFRKMTWNDNKYWMIKDSNKNEMYIEEVKCKAEYFLKLFSNKGSIGG